MIEEQNGGVYVSYYADYYPFGWTMPERNGGSSYRYAYQACLSCLCRQGQEKDPETGWEAFELRMYDGRVGRWMTTDPYSEFHSPYLAMGNNPISSIDPDGGKVFGIGVNNAGKVVYDDGKADGMIYYLGNYDGELITSQEMLFDKMFDNLDAPANSNQVVITNEVWLDNYEWVGTNDNLRSFIQGQYNQIDGVTDFTNLAIISFTGNQEYKIQTSTYTLQRFADGSVNAVLTPRGQWSFDVSNNKQMWDNINVLRSILVHESDHLSKGFQASKNGQTIVSFATYDDFLRWNAQSEVDAYRFQKGHYTWEFFLPSSYRNGVLRNEDAAKRNSRR